MNRLLLAAAIAVTCLSLHVSSMPQDPLAVSPDAYRLEFENAWVKVVRVVYAPNAVIVSHFHPELAAAFIYLNDGGPIHFKHEGLFYGGVIRPATKAGSFRVYKGRKEVHAVENPTATRNDFLRVEFKTEPLEQDVLKGKFFRDDPAPAETVQRTHFENAQVRITRIRVVPGETLRLTTQADQPALLVALTSAGVASGERTIRQLETGQTAWIDATHAASIRPTGQAAEVLRFDFKTRPMERR